MTTKFALLLASFRAVITAVTLASSGFYLHRRNMITSDGKKAMARFSQQLALPALYFSKIVACSSSSSSSFTSPTTMTQQFPPQFVSTNMEDNYDDSSSSCPNIVLDHLGDVWILAFWPFYVVGCGLLVGELAVYLSGTSAWYRKSALAACSIGNSSSLPLALLSVTHLETAQSYNKMDGTNLDPTVLVSVYVLLYPLLQWGMGSWLLTPDPHRPRQERCLKRKSSSDGINDDEGSFQVTINNGHKQEEDNRHDNRRHLPPESQTSVTFGNVILQAICQLLQPPAVGSLLGFLVAYITPLRGLFVNLTGDRNDPILGWLLDGITKIGRAAVPLGMAILGTNFSAVVTSHQAYQGPATPSVSRRTILAILVTKMVIMPCIGISTVWMLKEFFWNVPENIAPSLYLVLMIETITPTANSVMVMVEIFGSSKEEMARIIAWQYVAAPILLSITVSLVVHVAGKSLTIDT